jgi:hypothetical protein
MKLGKRLNYAVLWPYQSRLRSKQYTHCLSAAALPQGKRPTPATRDYQGKRPRPKAESWVLTASGCRISDAVSAHNGENEHYLYGMNFNAIPKGNVFQTRRPLVTVVISTRRSSRQIDTALRTNVESTKH